MPSVLGVVCPKLAIFVSTEAIQDGTIRYNDNTFLYIRSAINTKYKEPKTSSTRFNLHYKSMARHASEMISCEDHCETFVFYTG
mmetsp:Transcript_10962/g.20907  ORF Transcript_10962/g.20907 Transcript_10962/m.20907 type:complete len:84 (-) Transcript_10962:435-686(-)